MDVEGGRREGERSVLGEEGGKGTGDIKLCVRTCSFTNYATLRSFYPPSHFPLLCLHIQLSLTVFYTFNSSAISLSTNILCVYFTVVDGPTGNSSPRVGSFFNVRAEASFDIGVM